MKVKICQKKICNFFQRMRLSIKRESPTRLKNWKISYDTRRYFPRNCRERTQWMDGLWTGHPFSLGSCSSAALPIAEGFKTAPRILNLGSIQLGGLTM
jgi:hypothetical protein